MDTPTIAIVAATLMGPVLAVQAQKWIERWNRKRDSKDYIFKVLMATRATRLSPEHVQALNGIEMAFYGPQEKDKDVVSAWRSYLDNLATTYPDTGTNEFNERRLDLFVKLLRTMAKSLGYPEFDDVHIKKMAYSPLLFENQQNEFQALRTAAIDVLSGKKALKIAVDQ